MLKNRKFLLILTTVVVLLPMIVGLCLWSVLPDSLATHFDETGTADGWSSKAFAVFALPLFIFACHWLCIGCTLADPKAQNISEKIFSLIAWICPAVSLFSGTAIYSAALGISLNVASAGNLLMAILFIVLGNYLPKCKPNYTVGIKLPWTLHDEENWRRTHRFAGYLWMIGGVILLATAFLPNVWILLPVLLILAFAPMLYSYILYVRSK